MEDEERDQSTASGPNDMSNLLRCEYDVENDPVVVRIGFVTMIEPLTCILVEFDVTTISDSVNTDSRIQEIRAAVCIGRTGGKDLDWPPLSCAKTRVAEMLLAPDLTQKSFRDLKGFHGCSRQSA